MTVPKYEDLMNPLLQALHELGGSASIRELEEAVAKLLHLSEQDIALIHRGTTTKFGYRLAWARNYLKNYGLTENSSRGSLELMRREFDNHEFDASRYATAKIKNYYFGNMGQKWLELVNKTRTIGHYSNCESHIRCHLEPYFRNKDIREIRAKDVEDLFVFLISKPIQERGREIKPLSPKSVKNILGTLQDCLTWFWRREEKQHQCPPFPAVTVPQQHRGWINAEKQRKIVTHMEERHQIIFETLIETSERPSETGAHKIKDLLEGEIVTERAFDKKGNLKDTKAHRVKYTVVSLELWNKLIRHAKGRFPDDYLFKDENGEPYTGGRLYKIWIKACETEGIQIALVAGTRRSRASQKRQEGEKAVLEEISKDLGHSNTGTTLHYARSRKEEIK